MQIPVVASGNFLNANIQRKMAAACAALNWGWKQIGTWQQFNNFWRRYKTMDTS
jgi:hypothetical protein